MDLRLASSTAFGFALACSAALELDELDDGMCDEGEKACNDMCVSERSPSFGCATSSCVPCTLSNAVETCDPTGRCAIASCLGDFRDCNAMPQDGCEIDVVHDPEHCGGCTAAPCELDHAREGCADGLCTILSCDEGWDDCNEMVGDGCETDVTTPARCGDCETVCDAAQSCVDGACA